MRRIAVILLLVSFGVGCAKPDKKLLSLRVPRFEFHGRDLIRGGIVNSYPGGIHEAVVNLATQTKVRICLEHFPERPDVPPPPVEIAVRDKTIEEILRQIVQQDPRYEFRERLGVIEVLPLGAADDPENCLNKRIPLLRVRYSWRLALSAVGCELDILGRNPFAVVPDPLRHGRCSPRRAAHPGDKVIEATFVFKRARDILDEICAREGTVAWMASFRSSTRACVKIQDIPYGLIEPNVVIGYYQISDEPQAQMRPGTTLTIPPHLGRVGSNEAGTCR